MEYVIKEKVEIPAYANVDGQDSLDRFTHTFKKQKKRPSKNNRPKQKTSAEGNEIKPANVNPTNKVEDNQAPKKKRNNNKRRPKPNSNPNNPSNNDPK